MLTDEIVEEKRQEFLRTTEEVARLYKKILQCRQKLQAIPRGMKPKQYRRLLWELRRTVVKTSRAGARAALARRGRAAVHRARCAAAVDELRPVERDIARVQRKLETWPGARAEGIKDLRKEQRAFGQQPAAARRAVRRLRHGAAPHAARSSPRRTTKPKPPRRS